MDTVFSREPVITVPHGRGGSTDRSVRLLAATAKKHLGCELRIQNLTGINGAYALDLMVDSIRALPDGDSLSTANTSVILSPLVGRTKYIYTREIRPLLMYAEAPFLLAVSSDSPYDSLDDFIRYASDHPGKLTAGNSGIGNVSHVLMEILCAKAGIRLGRHSYDSGYELMQGLAAHEIDCLISNAVDMRTVIAENKVKILASSVVSSGSYPCFRDLGYPLEAYLRQGIGTSVLVPEEKCAFLERAFAAMAMEDALVSGIREAGMAYRYMSGREYAELWRMEESRWRSLLQDELGRKIREEILKIRSGQRL